MMTAEFMLSKRPVLRFTTNDLVLKMAKLANMDLSANKIWTSHRLSAKPNRNINTSKPSPFPPIIVRFLSRDIRNKFYQNRLQLRQASLKNFRVEGTDCIYINGNLTRYRKKLF